MNAIVSVVGARPNFVKMAPISRACLNSNIKHIIVHTGQHYDFNMSQSFFHDLNIPKPDINFNVGSGSHISQISQIMVHFEDFCIIHNPKIVLVYGDVNSTLACSLVCNKLSIPLAHIESGLRSYDRSMPEEINRILTDQLSDLLFTTSKNSESNLIKEGISSDKIFFVGNLMIDSLVHSMPNIMDSKILKKLSIEYLEYDVITLHRPSNVNNRENILLILKSLIHDSFDKKIVFPMHPRTKDAIFDYKLEYLLENPKFIIIDPLGYLDFIFLVKHSRSIWTDSGGIQEESSYLGVPCYTLRHNTERPVTLTLGSNKLVKISKDTIVSNQLQNKNNDNSKRNKCDIPLWDGNTASRILKKLIK